MVSTSRLSILLQFDLIAGGVKGARLHYNEEKARRRVRFPQALPIPRRTIADGGMRGSCVNAAGQLRQ
jgi:hypothetical protein